MRLLTLAERTVAFTPPKYTEFAVGLALKPVPLIVTVVPMGPEAGVKVVITGCADTLATTARIRRGRINDFIKM